MSNNCITKIKIFDNVNIKLEEENLYITSYIYEVDDLNKKYKIFHNLKNKFDYVDFNTDLNFNIKLNNVSKYYFGRLIEFYDFINLKWVRGFFYKYEINCDICYVIPFDKFIDTDFYNFAIQMNINNIKPLIDDNYFEMNEIIEYNKNDVGRIYEITNNNNNYNYSIKSNNSNILNCENNLIIKTNYNYYFFYDLVLFWDENKIISEGIIFNFEINKNDYSYNIIKIQDNLRIKYIKNIQQSEIIKFIKNYSFKYEIDKILYKDLDILKIDYIKNLCKKDFFIKEHFFYDNKNYFKGQICDYFYDNDDLYFVLNNKKKNIINYYIIELSNIIDTSKFIDINNYSNNINSSLKNLNYHIDDKVFFKSDNLKWYETTVHYIDLQNLCYYLIDNNENENLYKVNIIDEKNKIKLIKKNSLFFNTKYSDDFSNGSHPNYEINNSKDFDKNDVYNFENNLIGNNNYFNLNENNLNSYKLFNPKFNKNSVSNIYCVSEIDSEEEFESKSNDSDNKNNNDNKNNDNLKIKYKKYTFKDYEKKIEQDYFESNHKYSSSLDILASYLKGQKIIYMESKAHCDILLNCLMMPSILLSSAASVLTTIVDNYYWGSFMIAGINGLISFLLALVSYYKLDASSEAHKTASHRYDKLQTSVEFLSGKSLLFLNTLVDPDKIISGNPAEIAVEIEKK
jgi:hypothetical protein